MGSTNNRKDEFDSLFGGMKINFDVIMFTGSMKHVIPSLCMVIVIFILADRQEEGDVSLLSSVSLNCVNYKVTAKGGRNFFV